jgi:hypothetical protein
MANLPSPGPALLGARIRPPDPREVRYRLPIPTLPDMTEPASVGLWMPPVKSQQFGSCVGHTVTTAAECLYAVTHHALPDPLDPYVVYWDARVKQSFFGEGWGADTGCYAADAFDSALAGVPLDHLWPTPTHAGEAPPDSLRADAPNQDWILGHQPFYASDPGGFLAGLWTAFANLQPVGLAMAWYSRWFDHYGVLPDDTGPLTGYHEVCAYAAIPQGMLHPEALIVVRNSWGAYSDVSQLRSIVSEAQPGDVAIPAHHFQNGTVNECRAATAEAIVVPPFEDCAEEVQTARNTDEGIVLRVRDQYKTQTARNALTKAARAIHDQ